MMTKKEEKPQSVHKYTRWLSHMACKHNELFSANVSASRPLQHYCPNSKSIRKI